MSIKSERAKKFIQNKITNACDPRYIGHRYTMMLGRNNAFKAVKIAEADARERAVRVFNESCPSYYIYWEIGMCDETGDEQHVQCQSVECEAREAFLRHYDNEQ